LVVRVLEVPQIERNHQHSAIFAIVGAFLVVLRKERGGVHSAPLPPWVRGRRIEKDEKGLLARLAMREVAVAIVEAKVVVIPSTVVAARARITASETVEQVSVSSV
jgi:hypothetical protein